MNSADEIPRKQKRPSLVLVFLGFTLLVSIPFAVTQIMQGSLAELSKVVFSLYLTVPVTAILWGWRPISLQSAASVLTILSLMENIDWRLAISQKANEAYHVVINPQWLLVIISTIALIISVIRLIQTRRLTQVFSIIVIVASLVSSYMFHYLVINAGIQSAIADHYEKMKMIDTKDKIKQTAVCVILKLTCVQDRQDNLIKTLDKLELDRDSIITLNEYAKDKNIFYAWRETDILSAALNGNGVLIGYIKNDEKPVVVIDRMQYSVKMNREESLFMYLVIIFHCIWIPGWIFISFRHKGITLKC